MHCCSAISLCFVTAICTFAPPRQCHCAPLASGSVSAGPLATTVPRAWRSERRNLLCQIRAPCWSSHRPRPRPSHPSAAGTLQPFLARRQIAPQLGPGEVPVPVVQIRVPSTAINSRPNSSRLRHTFTKSRNETCRNVGSRATTLDRPQAAQQPTSRLRWGLQPNPAVPVGTASQVGVTPGALSLSAPLGPGPAKSGKRRRTGLSGS